MRSPCTNLGCAGSAAVPERSAASGEWSKAGTIRACYWIKQTENVGGGGGQVSAECG